ncbi:VanZ family protein [Actinomycetaceae bacterium Sa1BUA1]|uniref:VanZ family protein n=2 Tax=Oceanitalea stevensii TaxID=2763072 RepID=A0ABR8Z6R1_9MICO|nr:VanZ family protein [Oceanitalea stevensii]
MLGAIAVVLGLGAGAVLFVGFVALSYRRRGSFSVPRAIAWAAALVYFWAIWTYTLLPLPDPAAIRCMPTNLDPLAFLDEIGAAVDRAQGRPLAALTDPAVMQITLNVLLFVPLGFFARLLGGRGVAVAAVGGLATSAVVELTQLTGVWGLYPCAYRVFDVDDLLTNTTGAVLGSVLAFVVPRRHWGRNSVVAPEAPRPVTVPRRLLAMVSDWLAFTLVGAGAAIVVQALLLYVLDDRPAALEGHISTTVGVVVPLLVWLVVTLATGRTVGDIAVRLRYTGSPLPPVAARLLRLGGGIGGYGLLQLLQLLPSAAGWVGPLLAAFPVVALVATLATEHGRGLPGLASRHHLEDSRARGGGPAGPAPWTS